MSQISILDLNYCHDEMIQTQTIRGGISTTLPHFSVSGDVAGDVAGDVVGEVSAFVVRTGQFSAAVGYSVAGAAAGATAGAVVIGSGKAYAHAYVSVSIP